MLSSRHDALSVSGIGNRARGEPKNSASGNNAEWSSGDQAYNITQFLLEVMKKDSHLFQNSPSLTLPKFKSNEVSLEKNLGQGEFGVVFSIDAIHTKVDEEEEEETPKHDRRSVSPENETSATDDETETADDSLRIDDNPHQNDEPLAVEIFMDCKGIGLKGALPPGLEQRDLELLLEPNVSKGYMRKHIMRGGMSRYAIKRLKKDLRGPTLTQATADLASEANFLMTLRHPNICRMRGTIGEPGKRGFSIVMDRLTLTLREKMVEWKKKDDSGSLFSKLKKILGNQSKSKLEEKLMFQREIYGEKLLAAYDVARALRYLADHSIVFRDLKPENLAFDLRGDLRLFDMKSPGMYKMTGQTGSRRYMAPEVMVYKDYGLAVDVYSFAIMFWEMMSNRDAYFYMGPEKHFETVVTRRKRPNLKKMISKKVAPQGSIMCGLIEKSWSHDPSKRPGIQKICEELFSEIISVSNEEGKAVDRSSHLAAGSLKSRIDEPLWC
ncbi:unnamed protein product [Cylindrotheca closterium]|uniref:Protein kinase domain-containing protein n=1 Tax=Cylindrotheca closterium TaxID=2856 RepID=A0AAD2CH81_9STRA|nr:unnamed protein product [Cylindrotheca closterium]